MPKFGKRSRQELLTCHPDLQAVFNEVIKHVDCSVLDGSRTLGEQRENVRRGVSKTMRSKHIPPTKGKNIGRSLAVDVAPFPIDWDDEPRFYLFAGYVLATADQMGIKLRWGGDWDGDGDLSDQTFNDLVHFELVNP